MEIESEVIGGLRDTCCWLEPMQGSWMAGAPVAKQGLLFFLLWFINGFGDVWNNVEPFLLA